MGDCRSSMRLLTVWTVSILNLIVSKTPFTFSYDAA